MTTLKAPNPPHPRYSTRPFPPYRFILGETPHPTADPEGHSFGKFDEYPGILTPENWPTNEMYLYGVDLDNYAYWWEAHEAFEVLWGEFPRGSLESDFLQGLIKISAAFLKWHMKDHRGVEIHYEGGTGLLSNVAARYPVYMGLDLKAHLEKLEKHFKAVLAGPGEWPDALVDYPFIVLRK